MDLRYLSPKAKQRTAWQHSTVSTRHTRLAPDIVIVTIIVIVIVIVAIIVTVIVIVIVAIIVIVFVIVANSF